MMAMSLQPVQRIETTQRQSQDLVLAERIALIAELHGRDRFTPRAACPQCGHELSVSEILKGFVEDPLDRNTTCPNCEHRFLARFVSKSLASSIEIMLLCKSQTLYDLGRAEMREMMEMERENASLYHSALFHFGTLTSAYAAIGITYPYDEVFDVRKKVELFLGCMPDTIIAEISGLSRHVIFRMRKKERIAAFDPKHQNF